VRGYALLVNTVWLFNQMPIAAFDLACEAHYQQLRGQRVRIGTQDLRISAVALVHNLTLLTRNRGDFGRVPGLRIDDWSA
jgi:tRNA(fMet)-specific endonuclease VapC